MKKSVLTDIVFAAGLTGTALAAYFGGSAALGKDAYKREPVYEQKEEEAPVKEENNVLKYYSAALAAGTLGVGFYFLTRQKK